MVQAIMRTMAILLLILLLLSQSSWVQSTSGWTPSALLGGTPVVLRQALRTVHLRYVKATGSPANQTRASTSEMSTQTPHVANDLEANENIESRLRGSRVFMCHPGFAYLARALFPEAPRHDISRCTRPVAGLMNSAGKCDVVIRGYDQPCGCSLSNFPGVAIARNGEPQYLSDGKPIAKNSRIIEIGPTKHQMLPHRRQFFNAQFISVEPEYARLINGPPAQVVRTTRRFMAYRSSKCVRHREEAFSTIAKYIETKLRHDDVGDALGNCYGGRKDLHVKPKSSGSNWQNIDYMKNRYRFSLTMDKVNEVGYISEKILVGFAVGSIPIYYGTPEVFSLFNREAFIYYDPDNPQPALERILHLETNTTAFEEVLSKPKIAEGALETYFSLTKDIGGGSLRASMLKDIINVCTSLP